MGNELTNLSLTQKPNKNSAEISQMMNLQQVIKREDGIIMSSTFTPIKYFILKSHTTIDRYVHQIIKSNCERMKGIKYIKIEVISQSQFCSKQYTLKALFQHFDHTLKQQINERKEDPINCSFTVTDILCLYRFVINLFREHIQNKLSLPILGLQNIKVLKQQSQFKLINPLLKQFDQHYSVDQVFYSPESFGLRYRQSQIVFSLGMLLLSVSLLDDCSDCYDMKNSNFCWSVLQQKLMKLSQLQYQYSFDALSLRGTDLTSYSNLKSMSKLQKNAGMKYSGQLTQAIYWMLQKNPQQRPSIQQTINLYRQILKNLRQKKPDSEQQQQQNRFNTSLNNILKDVLLTQNYQQVQCLSIKASKLSINKPKFLKITSPESKNKELENIKNSRNKQNRIGSPGIMLLKGKQSNYLF